jgi:hypothetical protein
LPVGARNGGRGFGRDEATGREAPPAPITEPVAERLTPLRGGAAAGVAGLLESTGLADCGRSHGLSTLLSSINVLSCTVCVWLDLWSGRKYVITQLRATGLSCSNNDLHLVGSNFHLLIKACSLISSVGAALGGVGVSALPRDAGPARNGLADVLAGSLSGGSTTSGTSSSGRGSGAPASSR